MPCRCVVTMHRAWFSSLTALGEGLEVQLADIVSRYRKRQRVAERVFEAQVASRHLLGQPVAGKPGMGIAGTAVGSSTRPLLPSTSLAAMGFPGPGMLVKVNDATELGVARCV